MVGDVGDVCGEVSEVTLMGLASSKHQQSFRAGWVAVAVGGQTNSGRGGRQFVGGGRGNWEFGGWGGEEGRNLNFGGWVEGR